MGWFVMKEEMVNNIFSEDIDRLGFKQKSNYAVYQIEKFIRQNFSESEIPAVLNELYKKLN